MNRSGEPLSEEYMAERRAKLSAGVNRATAARGSRGPKSATATNWHSPESQRKAANTRLQRWRAKQKLNQKVDEATAIRHDSTAYYVKLQEKGIFRCPECSKTAHRTVEFPDAKELGKHRRFKHGVIGAKHLKRDGSIKVKGADFHCPECPRSFTTQHGLNIHSQAHKGNKSDKSEALVPTEPKQELVHANGQEKEQTDFFTPTHSYATVAEMLMVTGPKYYIKSYLDAQALRFNIPPITFALQVLDSLTAQYREEAGLPIPSHQPTRS